MPSAALKFIAFAFGVGATILGATLLVLLVSAFSWSVREWRKRRWLRQTDDELQETDYPWWP